ncbi:MAG: hypothetical protein ACJ74G_08680 [Blastocatellia bacterium]
MAGLAKVDAAGHLTLFAIKIQEFLKPPGNPRRGGRLFELNTAIGSQAQPEAPIATSDLQAMKEAVDETVANDLYGLFACRERGAGRSIRV